MEPELAPNSRGVRAMCPDCGAPSTFERKAGGSDFGHFADQQIGEDARKGGFGSREFLFLKCAVCARAGFAQILVPIQGASGRLPQVIEFHPRTPDHALLPERAPDAIQREFREAECCAGYGLHRAASGMFRSVLEKTLRANGYRKGNLKSKIDTACEEGVITSPRRNRAHEDIRVLGNDVLHDEWRPVTAEEVELARHYAQRILEDFYDDREEVEKLLKDRLQRMLPADTATARDDA